MYEVQTLTPADSISKGLKQGYEISERKRQQPILEKLEQSKLKSQEQAVELGEKSLSLKDLSIRENQRKEKDAFREDVAGAANWILSQPKEQQEQAFNSALDFYESEGQDVSKYRGRLDLVPMLAQFGKDKATGEKFGAVQEGVDSEGNPVFAQVGTGGTVKKVEDIKPYSAKDKANAAGDKAYSQETRKTDALALREQRLEGEQLKIQKDKLAVLAAEMKSQEAMDKRAAADIEAFDSIDLYNDVLNSDLSLIYGIDEKLKWEKLRTQPSVDLRGKRNRLVATMELAAASKMKGQGSLSDPERKILKDAATLLSDDNISPDLAKRELERGLNALRKAAEPAIVRRDAAKKQKEIDGALEWLQQYPNDPRAQEVKLRLGL